MSEFTEWKSLRFKDICRLKSDKVTVDSSDIQTYISTENMLPNFGGVQSAKNIPLTGKLNTFKYGDVLFSNIRTYFKKVWIATFDGVASPDVLIFSAMKNCESQYLYYMMCEPQFTEFTVLTSRGAKMPRGDKEAILNYEISLPSLAEQKAIVSVLSSLDNKIDLLHRQNKTLEAMAETLFRQCFVEEAQDDWEEVNVLNIFSLVGGGTPKTSIDEYWNGNIPWISGGDISQSHKGFISKTEKSITELGLKSSSTKLLPKFSTIISARGTVGRYAMLEQEMCFSQSNYGIIPKGHNCYYFVYLLIGFIVDELLAAAYGSVFDTITTRTFESVDLKLPEMSEIINFEAIVIEHFKKKELNSKQIQTLEKLRDTLLPKLMSGEVRVSYTPEEIKQ